ncbi:hypothetical protein H4R27_003016 [Coemansia aciculifera]|nr:hypothetical protein H4R27_003016 [Coemansia aciculifera]
MTKALDISAVQVVDNMFGAAIYDTIVHQLSVMCVTQQQPTSKLALQSLIKQTLADVVLHPQGNTFDGNVGSMLSELSSFDVKFREIVPVGIEAFDFVSAEKRLFGLTENMAAAAKESIELDERINEGFVYEHRLSVGCAGALLAYLSETTNGQLAATITVKKSFMLVDAKTLETKSTDGREMLKNWIMCPLQSLTEVSERQASVTYLAMDMHSKVLDEMCGVLSKVKSIKVACLRIQTELLLADLESLAQFAYAIVKLHGLVTSISTAPILIKAFLAIDQSRLAALGAMIIDSVDFDTSRLDERIVIASGVSSKVDHLREKFSKLDDLLLLDRSPGDIFSLIVVLVGPNASGKSVLLKQIALIVYMAHIGSPVPAKSAVVGLTDRVLAMGKTTESLSRKMSALSADLSAVAKITELASTNSLVLLDEFGRGTAPVDGVSLLCGVLASLSLRNDNRPSVLAATHFQGK